MLKVDVFNHIFPEAVFRAAAAGHRQQRGDQALAPHPVPSRARRAVPDDRRVRRPTIARSLSLSAPPIESINPDRQVTLDLARLANDSHGGGGARASRIAFRASSPRCRSTIPTRASPSSSAPSPSSGRSASRCSRTSTACRSTISGSSPLFETADRLRCPILLHPARGAGVPGLSRRERSRNTRSGGPSDGRTRPARRCSGWCSRGCSIGLPNIKIVAHHLGAMIPYFEGRIGYGLDQFGARTADEDYEGLRAVAAQAALRLLQDVLGRHGGLRQPGGDRVRPEVLRRRPGRVRVRRAVRSRGRSAVHPRDDQGDRQPRHLRGRPAQASTRATPSGCSTGRSSGPPAQRGPRPTAVARERET